MYFSGSKAKLEIALAKGKKLYDKRNDLKEKAAKEISKSLLKITTNLGMSWIRQGYV